ncbi:hypothetical protein Cch01nite_40240 [Cellulomonas chitinilytica]|uniref:DUF305 domain-containing protein n=1 Tax=Cellulomonas chitinilytica TaxID=398759 RepID=A0A919U0U9_9CELL|nr:DUF305 domain-containing protein [Cellulomonas chitinilytica]GIG23300.1 hypothetical protein Cch01nite_40240 [Cellulomonas chitinilytica]
MLVVVLAVALAGGALVASAVGWPAPPADGLRPADVAFVDALVPEHEQTRSSLASVAGRVTDPELAVLVAAIGATQADELTTLRAWRGTAAVTGVEADDAPAHGHTATTAEPTDGLDAPPGADLDTAVALLLVAQQQTAGELARTRLEEGGDDEVGAFAQRVADSRTAQVAQLLRLLERLDARAP